MKIRQIGWMISEGEFLEPQAKFFIFDIVLLPAIDSLNNQLISFSNQPSPSIYMVDLTKNCVVAADHFAVAVCRYANAWCKWSSQPIASQQI